MAAAKTRTAIRFVRRAGAALGIGAVIYVPFALSLSPEDYDERVADWSERIAHIVTSLHLHLFLLVAGSVAVTWWFATSGDPARIASRSRKVWQNVWHGSGRSLDDGAWTPSPTAVLDRQLIGAAAESADGALKKLSQGEKGQLYAAQFGAKAARDRDEREIFGYTATELADARSRDPLNEIAPLPPTPPPTRPPLPEHEATLRLKALDELHAAIIPPAMAAYEAARALVADKRAVLMAPGGKDRIVAAVNALREEFMEIKRHRLELQTKHEMQADVFPPIVMDGFSEVGRFLDGSDTFKQGVCYLAEPVTKTQVALLDPWAYNYLKDIAQFEQWLKDCAAHIKLARAETLERVK